MKKTIAAVIAAAILAFSIPAGLYLNNHYTFVNGSLLSDSFIEAEIQMAQNLYRLGAMQGYQAGVQSGGESCKSHT